MTLTDDQVIRGFHSLLQDSLAQARGEGLLDDEELETAEPAVQIAAPSLALFFAALGSTGDPPSISSPDNSFILSSSNCSESFSNAFHLWQRCVPEIKRLGSEARHDLSLILCDKEPVSSPLRLEVSRIASDLKGISLEILQRRSFQLRFQSDLNVALDSNVRGNRRSNESERPSRSSFEPPPLYSEGVPTEETKRAYGDVAENGDRVRGERERRSQEGRSSEESYQARAFEQEENLNVIRETLYSAFADSIVESPTILEQLSRGVDWAPRAFFASTCLAILDVALTRVDEGGVRAVNLGRGSPKVIGPTDTPPHLRPLLGKLIELSQAVKNLATKDDEDAIVAATEGTNLTKVPRIERLRNRLTNGVGTRVEDDGNGDVREDQEVRMIANALNEMALGMTSLPAFRERQAEAFKVLVSITAL